MSTPVHPVDGAPVSINPASKPRRVASLDQFRGYTVFGMAFVNFLGGYAFLPDLFKHKHTFFSYADAIMPQFFFAVGYAFRLVLLRAMEREGYPAALRKGLMRCLGLMLVAFVVHGASGGVGTFDELKKYDFWSFLHAAFKRGYFQTLAHIAVTSLWVLPVIMLSGRSRLIWAILSAMIHIAISFGFKHLGWWTWSNYDWTLANPVAIDGGPLGFLTWTMPLIAGSFAFDWCSRPPGEGKPVERLLGWGAAIMLLAYGLSCLNLRFPPNQDSGRWLLEPPFVAPADPATKNYWTMSQRTGGVTYPMCAAGFSMVTMAVFVLLCDRLKWRWGVFDTLGSNALLAYILLGLLEDAIRPWVPKDSPAWFALSAWGLELGICWVILRNLQKNGVYIKV